MGFRLLLFLTILGSVVVVGAISKTATFGSGTPNDSTRQIIEDSGLIDGIAWVPDGQRLVIALNRAGINKGTNNLYQLDVASGKLTTLTKSQEEDTTPCVSPDGRYLAFFRGPYSESNIWIMSIGGRTVRQLTHFFAPRRNAKEISRAFSWSSDSKSIILVETSPGQPSQAYIINAISGAKRPFATMAKALNPNAGLLPIIEGLSSDQSGSRWAIFSLGEGHPRVSIINIDQPSKSITVDPYPGTLGKPRWSTDDRYVYVSADLDLTIPRERRTPTYRGKAGTFRIDANNGRIERMSAHYGEISPDGSKLVWEEPSPVTRNGFRLWLEMLSH